ncbi:MAG: hypothetical protein R3E89_18790 [Thiolinea sp.]
MFLHQGGTSLTCIGCQPIKPAGVLHDKAHTGRTKMAQTIKHHDGLCGIRQIRQNGHHVHLSLNTGLHYAATDDRSAFSLIIVETFI